MITSKSDAVGVVAGLIDQKRRLPLITNSSANAFRACPRKYEISYIKGYRAVRKSEALTFGTLIHMALEVWWKCKRIGDVLEALNADMTVDAFERAKAIALMIGYHNRWSCEPTETVFVEYEFTAPLINPRTGFASATYRIGGKIDGGTIVASQRYLVEHKTTSEDIAQGSIYWKRLRLDTQVSTYLVGAREFGFDAIGCLYDVIRKLAIRPSAIPVTDAEGVKIVNDANGERVKIKSGKKWRETGDADAGYVLVTRPETPEEFLDRCLAEIAEKPDYFYARGIVTRLDSDERDAAHDLWQTAQMMREAKNANRYPRNPRECMAYGRPCDYFAVCTGDASLDDEQLFRKADTEHEELAVK